MIKRGFLFTLAREMYRLKKYKTFTFCTIFMPIVTLICLWIILKSGVPHNLPIAILDEDKTTLSRQCTDMINSSQYVDVAYGITSIEQGRQMIRQGIINGVIVIPSEFQNDIYSNNQTSVSAFINGTNLLISALINKGVTTSVKTFSAGVEINKLVSTGVSQQKAYNISTPIYMDDHILFNPYTSYAYYLLPGFMPMMLLFFVVLSSIFAIGIELKKATAYYWLSSSGWNIHKAVAAKLFPYTMLFIILMIFMNAIMFLVLGMPLNGNLYILILGNILFILAYQSMGVLFIILFDNMRLALSLGAGYSVLAFSFSGLTFPLFGMSEPAQILSNLFPMTFYVDIFMDQAMRGAPIQHSMPSLFVLLIFSVLSLFFYGRLQNMCVNKKYWGKD